MELKEIVLTSDISPFEVNHSGLIRSLTVYLTEITLGIDYRSERLRKFLHVFAGYPVSYNYIIINSLYYKLFRSNNKVIQFVYIYNIVKELD